MHWFRCIVHFEGCTCPCAHTLMQGLKGDTWTSVFEHHRKAKASARDGKGGPTCEAKAHDHAGVGVGRHFGLVVHDPGARHLRAAGSHTQPCTSSQPRHMYRADEINSLCSHQKGRRHVRAPAATPLWNSGHAVMSAAAPPPGGGCEAVRSRLTVALCCSGSRPDRHSGGIGSGSVGSGRIVPAKKEIRL